MAFFDFLWMSEKDQKRLKEMDDGIRRMEDGLYEIQRKKEEAKRRREEEERKRIEELSRWNEDNLRNKKFLDSKVPTIRSSAEK